MTMTDTPQPQPGDVVESDAGQEDIRPNLKRHRTRRRRRYLLAGIPVIPAILLTLVVIRIGSMDDCGWVEIYPEPDSGVSFNLFQVLANAGMPVHVRACVRQQPYSTFRGAMPEPASSCASITVRDWSVGLFEGRGFGSDWYLEGSSSRVVRVKDPSLTSEPITVQLTMEDQAGNSMFDSSAVVQPHMFAPIGPPPCPVTYDATVTATQTGRLVPYP
jgi:hypothetical protein